LIILNRLNFSEGKLSFGSLYEELSFEAATKEVTNLDYKRRTAASYVELQSKFDKVSVIVGGRAEDYNITGKTDKAELTAFKISSFQMLVHSIILVIRSTLIS
jgi:outer membrane receptor protein involved in Fe transport